MSEINRRDFLKTLALSFAALTAEGCKPRAPREKIVPALDQTEFAPSGVSTWYASTCGGCSAACGVLVKSRDGRPIKMEGNPDHPLSLGGLCARGQATVLDLYDSQRLRGPRMDGAAVSWAAFDASLSRELQRAHKTKAVRLLGPSLSGPSEREAAAIFLRKMPGARRVAYDALSSSAILDAHALTHGRRILPHYRFDRAKAIIAFDADFLGTWISPVEFTRAWAKGRRPDQGMSWHAQFESRMSLSGANADLRALLRPSQQLAAVLGLGRRLAERLSWRDSLPRAERAGLDERALDEAAVRLAAAGRGRGLVVSGSPDVSVQIAINWINEGIGAYGSTADLAAPSLQCGGDDRAVDELIDEMRAGEVAALIVDRVNPVYDHPRGLEFAEALKRVPLVAAIADRLDETASLARWVAPASHALESWGDAEPVAGTISVFQPLLRPLYDSRPALETLLALSGVRASVYDFVKKTWRSRVFPRRRDLQSFKAFWEDSVRRGTVVLEAAAASAPAFDFSALRRIAPSRPAAGHGEFELVAYPTIALADGRQANNPWLQEMPDPITKVAWGNYASFAADDARRLGLEEGRIVRLAAAEFAVELPAHIQPGQAAGVVAVPIGYGRTKAGLVAANYPVRKWLPIEQEPLSGANTFPFLRVASVAVVPQGDFSPLAKSQIQDSLTDPILGQKRPFFQETTLDQFLRDPQASQNLYKEEQSLWPRREYKGQKWLMTVDLNLCTGCGACDVACRSENNTPVVGKAEIRKNRTLSWIRDDRYYDQKPGRSSPDVAFMPVMCQQCDNAPCETVCPVIATSHTSDGLNAQVYNRCVGTRYCENNCPYKSRRFNWFDYSREDEVQNLVLNPDVTVRSRGVVEKCTFCVQRIHAARLTAKSENRALGDGEIQPACVQSCPAQALVFGDGNDPASRVSREGRDPRGYRLLGELGVAPSVIYKTKVRNRSTS